ncbi:zinc-binding dehydrogenase [Streptomyces sp. NPDC050804]|uniref:zinc-binding dehydrogenase n=1 Tax=Streptomyces sp. NPDC050804 TaxID=3154745 RepID=UPI00341F0E52
MSRAVVYETFGGPEVLELREVPEPHAGPGEVRVHVTAAGLNPMDWGIASRPELAARFGISVPSGFGYDFGGIETAETALALGVPPERISTIAAGPNPPGGVRATGGFDASPDTMERISGAILAGAITVPIAATFPIGQIRDAVTLQAGRHVHGKVVIRLRPGLH